VTVCPTGIDIRDGIQLECVNCTACIDACNDVMHRIGKAPGLIRLTSHRAVVEGKGRWLTARALSYSTVWLVLVSAVTMLLVSRRPLDVLILRQPGTMYTAVGTAEIANFYNVQAFNRTAHATTFAIEVIEPAGATLTTLGPMGEVAPYALLEGRLLVRVPATALKSASTPVRFAVRTDRGVVQTVGSAFLGPAPGKD
jgi:polyferredoxin